MLFSTNLKPSSSREFSLSEVLHCKHVIIGLSEITVGSEAQTYKENSGDMPPGSRQDCLCLFEETKQVNSTSCRPVISKFSGFRHQMKEFTEGTTR